MLIRPSPPLERILRLVTAVLPRLIVILRRVVLVFLIIILLVLVLVIVMHVLIVILRLRVIVLVCGGGGGGGSTGTDTGTCGRTFNTGLLRARRRAVCIRPAGRRSRRVGGVRHVRVLGRRVRLGGLNFIAVRRALLRLDGGEFCFHGASARQFHIEQETDRGCEHTLELGLEGLL